MGPGGGALPVRKITWKWIKRRIAEGYGSGHGEHYKPWLAVGQSGVPGRSNQKLVVMPGRMTRAATMSRGEERVALVLYWLGVSDVRTQYPMWPMRHAHPGTDIPGFDWPANSLVAGLLDIAKVAGIIHGIELGTNVPYVATLDIVVTHELYGRPELAAISIKPRDLLNSAGPNSRMLQRLELERRYAQEAKLPYVIADRHVIPDVLWTNVNDLCPRKFVIDATQKHETFMREFEQFANQSILELTKREIEIAAQRAFRRTRVEIQWALRQLMWSSSLDIDLSKPIIENATLPLGATRIKKALMGNLLPRKPRNV